MSSFDDQCMGSRGDEFPEHDFPPEDEGNECRRCGAEASQEEW